MSKAAESQEEKQTRHIQEMQEQLNRRFGNSMALCLGNDLSLSQKEKFLENIIFMEMEEVNEQPLFDYLEKGGISLPQPATLDDTQLHEKLWEVIHAMAELGQFLYNTDHLSDRGLYETLWKDILREPASISADSTCVAHIDILGGCSEEDIEIRLKYYAEEDEREDWAEQYPEDEIPEHEDLPYDRDRLLPSPYGDRA